MQSQRESSSTDSRFKNTSWFHSSYRNQLKIHSLSLYTDVGKYKYIHHYKTCSDEPRPFHLDHIMIFFRSFLIQPISTITCDSNPLTNCYQKSQLHFKYNGQQRNGGSRPLYFEGEMIMIRHSTIQDETNTRFFPSTSSMFHSNIMIN